MFVVDDHQNIFTFAMTSRSSNSAKALFATALRSKGTSASPSSVSSRASSTSSSSSASWIASASSTNPAATAIDFQAMLNNERAKMREEEPSTSDPVVVFPDLDSRLVPLESIPIMDCGFSCVRYISEYINETEERNLTRCIYGKDDYLSNFGITRAEDERFNWEAVERMNENSPKWVALTKRKLKNIGGVPHPDGMYAQRMPGWLQQVCGKFEKERIMQPFEGQVVVPDQCLLNEYRDGKGISAHQDGSFYLPCAAVLSLLSPAIIKFYRKEEDTGKFTPVASLLLEPRSLLIFSGDAYSVLYHGIEDCEVDVCTDLVANMPYLQNRSLGEVVKRGNIRLSLTLRKVAKVARDVGETLMPQEQEEAKRRLIWWHRAVSEERI